MDARIVVDSSGVQITPSQPGLAPDPKVNVAAVAAAARATGSRIAALALRTVQPGDATRPHHLSDLSTQVESSGTVRVMDRAGFIDGLGRGSGNLNPRNERTLGFLRCQQGGRILVRQTARAGRDQYHRECSSAPTDFEIKHVSNYKELMCRLNGNLRYLTRRGRTLKQTAGPEAGQSGCWQGFVVDLRATVRAP